MNADFSPVSATVGGALIGLGASAMLLLEGRVSGVSGIVGGLLSPSREDSGWRAAFLIGLVGAGIGAWFLAPDTLGYGLDRSFPALIGGGLLVGFGTRLGGGCTSGHGVCGLSRLSVRSLVAVCVFMGVGMFTAIAVGRLFGGSL